VGDLTIASIVDGTLELTEKAEPQSASRGSHCESTQQIRRQVEIAAHLRERIAQYEDGASAEAFRLSCRAEARSLSMAMEGKLNSELLLKAISSCLVSATIKYTMPSWTKPLLGWVHGAFDATENAHVGHDLEKVIRQAVQEMADSQDRREHSSGYQAECEHGKGDSDVDALLQKLSVPKTLRLVWKFNANDIRRTVREASRRVLDDCGNDHDQRLVRVNALNILGREFHAAVEVRRRAHSSSEDAYPDVKTIEEKVKMALIKSVINEGLYE
jgi:hypothetical protein